MKMEAYAEFIYVSGSVPGCKRPIAHVANAGVAAELYAHGRNWDGPRDGAQRRDHGRVRRWRPPDPVHRVVPQEALGGVVRVPRLRVPQEPQRAACGQRLYGALCARACRSGMRVDKAAYMAVCTGQHCTNSPPQSLDKGQGPSTVRMRIRSWLTV